MPSAKKSSVLDYFFYFCTKSKGMSKRNKLKKFDDILKMDHVYENPDFENPQLIHKEGVVVDRKGKWISDHFKNTNSFTLELACGRGEYTLQLARKYPNRNFMGLDIKGARIWQGATIAEEENLQNVAFLRTRIELIGLFFAEQEIDEIWITFPDPFLRESKSNNRLTSNPFLDRFKPLLKKDGIINLKTDSTELYDFTMETLSERTDIELIYTNDDIYASDLFMEELEFKTYSERMHLENKKSIKFVRFRFK
jgi:tRNA (guanine-N7-)-methyltransferase